MDDRRRSMRKVVWLMMGVLGLLYLGLWRGAGIAQSTVWERYMAAGERLQRQGRPAEAARWYQAAIRRAERFGPADPRLAASLNRYAALLRANGQSAAAVSLEARARAVSPRQPGITSERPSSDKKKAPGSSQAPR
jgi:tetratricopeptide (TPR) repeat protein